MDQICDFFKKNVHTITNDVNWKASWGESLKNWDDYGDWVDFVANDDFFDMVYS